MSGPIDHGVPECPHGVPLDSFCQECEDERPYLPIPAGQPGLVEINHRQIEAGSPEFDHLTEFPHPGDDVRGAYLPLTDDVLNDVDRARGLCSMSLLELQRAMALASRQNMSDYERLGPKSLFVFLANRANLVNHLRPFTWASSGELRWFGVWDVIFGATRRGKGRHLAFVETPYHAALQGSRMLPAHDPAGAAVRVSRYSVAGLFGTFRQVEPGRPPRFTDSVILSSHHGVVLFPEMGNLTALFRGQAGGEAAGVLSEFMSSGDYSVMLAAGQARYRSYAYGIGAIQMPLWEHISDSVIGIDGRCLFSALPILDSDDLVGRLARETEGHPLDPLAVKVFAAKVARIEAELRPSRFDYSAVTRRLSDHIAHPTSDSRFDLSDLQRHVALSTGAYLANWHGLAVEPAWHDPFGMAPDEVYAPDPPLTGPIVLPDPWEVPPLRAAIEQDARIRLLFRMDPTERLILRVDELLTRFDFFGTRERPVARGRNEMIEFLARNLGADPKSIRNAIVGQRGRDGVYSGFISRGMLREVLFDPETGETAHRPVRMYRYVWPQDRSFLPADADEGDARLSDQG